MVFSGPILKLAAEVGELDYRLRTSDLEVARRVASTMPALRVLPDDELLPRRDSEALLVRGAVQTLDGLVAGLVAAGGGVRELAPVVAPLEAAFGRIGALVRELRGAGHEIDRVDLGGGLGVPYRASDVLPSPADYGAMVARATAGWDVELMFEPGRVITGNAGVLLTRVIWVKPGVVDPYVIVDAAMNDLARPALYDAWHDFIAVAPSGARMTANIAGPVCESGDTFAFARDIDRVAAGDLAVFRTAGAYGATMASTYNSRALVPEVLVDGDRYAVVADRVSAETLIAAERVPDWL